VRCCRHFRQCTVTHISHLVSATAYNRCPSPRSPIFRLRNVCRRAVSVSVTTNRPALPVSSVSRTCLRGTGNLKPALWISGAGFRHNRPHSSRLISVATDESVRVQQDCALNWFICGGCIECRARPTVISTLLVTDDVRPAWGG